MNCLIVGSGTFATCLATVLAGKGTRVALWCRRPERAEEIRRGRHSSLPDVALSDRIEPWDGVAPLPFTPDFVISAVPTQKLRVSLETCRERLPVDVPWVSVSKGVELDSLSRPSAVIEQELGVSCAVLSGPSHAEEVVLGVPTAVTLGVTDAPRGAMLQEALSTESFRVYSSSDPIGVEWGGALKNIIALAAGIAIGQGFGDNTLAALVTRGAVEMARIGEVLGGQRQTFSGLSGIGDLMVTCFSEHSRNRKVGVRVGQGESPDAVIESMSQVAEGVPTTKAVEQLGRASGLELPITSEVYGVFFQGKDVHSAVRNILSRSLKSE